MRARITTSRGWIFLKLSQGSQHPMSIPRHRNWHLSRRLHMFSLGWDRQTDWKLHWLRQWEPDHRSCAMSYSSQPMIGGRHFQRSRYQFLHMEIPHFRLAIRLQWSWDTLQWSVASAVYGWASLPRIRTLVQLPLLLPPRPWLYPHNLGLRSLAICLLQHLRTIWSAHACQNGPPCPRVSPQRDLEKDGAPWATFIRSLVG